MEAVLIGCVFHGADLLARVDVGEGAANDTRSVGDFAMRAICVIRVAASSVAEHVGTRRRRQRRRFIQNVDHISGRERCAEQQNLKSIDVSRAKLVSKSNTRKSANQMQMHISTKRKKRNQQNKYDVMKTMNHSIAISDYFIKIA